MITTLREKLNAQPPSEIAEFIKILPYGDPGAGKTWFAGTAGDSPLTGPILFLDIEGGVLTLRRMKGVEVVPARSMKVVQDTINELYNDTTGYYKTFCIDSITELQKLDMKEIMTAAFKRNPDKVDIDVPSVREWGKSGNHMREILRAAKDLPMHVIVTALEAHETDDQTGITKYYPSIPGKLRGEIPGFFDIVGRLEAKVKPGNSGEIIRVLQTAKTVKVIAKDRTNSLPALIEDPTIPKMWEWIALDATPGTQVVPTESLTATLAKVNKEKGEVTNVS